MYLIPGERTEVHFVATRHGSPPLTADIAATAVLMSTTRVEDVLRSLGQRNRVHQGPDIGVLAFHNIPDYRGLSGAWGLNTA